MKSIAICVVISCLGFCSQASGQGGIITTVAGNGNSSFSGDGGPATSASLHFPSGVAVDASGNLFIADQSNNRIRKVSASGTITTVAGGGTGGDGGQATSVSLFIPYGVAVDASGSLFIADTGNYRIRKVAASGTITTVAGNGNYGFSGDGGPATSASLASPNGVAVDAAGNLFVVDSDDDRIRKVSTNGIITTVAGNGNSSFSGDGGPATSASLNGPSGVAVDASGNLFIADLGNRRIRKVSATGIITTVAGNGTFELGDEGDGGPASSAELSLPSGVALDASGNLFIADPGDSRIRKVSASGIITTIAGDGNQGFSGDGGPAISASLNGPHSVALDASGNLFFADSTNNRIREVSPSGMADVIENLVLTGTVTCTESFDSLCNSFGTRLITGTYSLDVTAQAIVGAWSFSEPFGVISSSDPGANAYVASAGGYIAAVFEVNTSTVTEFVVFTFPGSDMPEIGAVVAGSHACINIPGGELGEPACDPNTAITGTTALAGTPGDPSIAPGGVVPVDGTVSTIQPGEWVSIYGTNLASSTVTWNGNFPTSLGGTSVTIDGKGAYLSFVSPTQINLQAPNDTSTGPVPVVVTTVGGTATSTVTLAQFAPSFLLLDSKHVAGIIVRSNGSGAYDGGAYDIIGPTGNSLGYPTVAAKAGDVVELFGTGFGPTNPTVSAGQAFSGAAPTTNPVTLLINNLSVVPTFAGLSGAGLYQINLTVPAGFGTGDVSLVATVRGMQTPPSVVISMQDAASTGPQIQSLTLSPSSVASGGTVTGSVSLFTAAPSSDAVVALSSSSSAASVPATVTVPSGVTSATFTIAAGTVSSSQTVTITASYGGSSAQASLTVTPPASGMGQLNVTNPFSFSAGLNVGAPATTLTTYTLTNSGTAALYYTVTADVPWLSFSPSNGTLAPNASAVVTISTNSSTSSLPVGSYSATVTFSSGTTSITRGGTLVIVNPPPSGCQYAAAGPYQFRVVNMLSTDVLVYFGNVVLPDGQTGSLSFGLQMQPNECDIVGLPEIAVYSVDVSRYPNGTVVPNSLTFTDTTSGFLFNGRSAYTVLVTSGTCSAAIDQGIQYDGQSVYSLCVP